MNTVILTGATGFIGQHLTRELSTAGYKVIALVKEDDFTGHISKIKNVEIVVCDISEYSRLPLLFEGKSVPEFFFHLAWVGSAGSARSDYRLQLDNIKYICDAYEAANKLGCRRFIGAGSIMEDESSSYLSLDDIKPSSAYIYSSAKLAAHFFCKAMSGDCKTEFCWGKISNAYGEGDTTFRFIDMLIRKMMCEKECDLTAGNQMYDFLYVSEVARAFRYIAERGRSNTAYYIGSTDPKPLKEFVIKMREVVNPNFILNFGKIPFRGVSLDATCFDFKKLMNDTGFSAKISFEEGIEKTIKWIRSQ
jgi:nucleoside-diphosphate-sugar epimerase